MSTTTAGQLKEGLTKSGNRELLERWASQPVFTMFARYPDGTDKPAPVGEEPELLMVFYLEPGAAEAVAAESSSPEDGIEFYARQVELWDLARAARFYQCPLYWPEQELILSSAQLEVLGNTALVKDAIGTRRYTLITVLPLEGPAAAAGQPALLQRWAWLKEDDQAVDQEVEGKAHRILFDDRMNWGSDQGMPELPDDAVARSVLTPSEQQAFDRWAQPMLGLAHQPSLERKLPEGIQPLPGSPVPVSGLQSLAAMDELVQAFLLPGHQNLKLEVFDSALAPSDEATGEPEAGDAPARFRHFRAVYLAQGASAPMALCEDSLLIDELENLPLALPETPGLHPMPEALRARLLRYLAWELLHASRYADGVPFLMLGRMAGFLTAMPDNSGEPFYAQPDDPRYPYLARMTCGPAKVPVIVIGEQDGDRVCVPVGNQSLPEADVPEDLPMGDEMVLDGELNIWGHAGMLRVPAGWLDCPEQWYSGTRLAAPWVVEQVRSGLYLMDFVTSEGGAKDKKVESAIGTVVTVSMIAFALFVLLLNLTGG